jgi:hypothetical protein
MLRARAHLPGGDQNSLRRNSAARSVAPMANAPDIVSEFKTLIATGEVPRLGPQRRPDALSVAEIDRKLAPWFKTARISAEMQPLLRSAALLWHDHLDESHTISQDIETRDGSWLHGIMHRREPDYGNAKYWFRRVGEHMAFPRLAERVTALLKDDRKLCERLIADRNWQSFAFIDECERAEQGKDVTLNATLRQIQAAEFDTLVEHILSHPL